MRFRPWPKPEPYRDTSRKRPDLVADWIETRAARASGLTVREAVKRLDPARRERILRGRSPAAARSRPPGSPPSPGGC